MKRVIVFFILTSVLVFSGCSIPKLRGPLLDNQKPNGKTTSTSSPNFTAFDDLFNNASLYENKRVTMSGYIYSADVKGNFITDDNQYLNLRDKPDMNNNLNMSMKITPQIIRKALIDEYNSKHGDWVKVEVSGTILLVKLGGLPRPGIILDVDSLIIKEGQYSNNIDCPIGVEKFFDESCTCPNPFNVKTGDSKNGFHCYGMPMDRLMPTDTVSPSSDRAQLEQAIRQKFGDNWQFSYSDDSSTLKRMQGIYQISALINNKNEAIVAASLALETIKDLIAIPVSDFTLKSVSFDGYLGRYEVVFQQNFNGLTVEKAGIYFSIRKNGELYNITNNTFPDLETSNNSGHLLSQSDIIKYLLAEKKYNFLKTETPTVTLTVLPPKYIDQNSYQKFCYKVTYDERTFFLDAYGGKVVLDYSNYLE